MSRRITIATTMDNPDVVEMALEDLKAEYTRDGATFRVKNGMVDQIHADGTSERFLYTGVYVDCENGQVGFDEDCSKAKRFVEGPLKQMYSKNLFIENASRDGHMITDQYIVDDAHPVVEGYVGDVPEGSIVFYAESP